MNLLAPTVRAAALTRSSLIPLFPRLMFVVMSPENRNTSWSTTAICLRRSAWGTFRMSTPSMSISPFWTS